MGDDQMTISIVPAASGFYALFLSPKGLDIPRQFFKHAIVAWQVTQIDEMVSAWPVCISEDAWHYDFILSPGGVMEHASGFVTSDAKEALGYALDQENMKIEMRSYPPTAAE
jgi:hypothetical protein